MRDNFVSLIIQGFRQKEIWNSSELNPFSWRTALPGSEAEEGASRLRRWQSVDLMLSSPSSRQIQRHIQNTKTKSWQIQMLTCCCCQHDHCYTNKKIQKISQINSFLPRCNLLLEPESHQVSELLQPINQCSKRGRSSSTLSTVHSQVPNPLATGRSSQLGNLTIQYTEAHHSVHRSTVSMALQSKPINLKIPTHYLTSQF